MNITVITWSDHRLKIKDNCIISYGEDYNTNFFPIIEKICEEK